MTADAGPAPPKSTVQFRYTHEANDAVYAFFQRWSGRGLPQRLVDALRARIRLGCGRGALPTAGSIDSQSVKAADTVGAATRGFDGGNHAGWVVMPGRVVGSWFCLGWWG